MARWCPEHQVVARNIDTGVKKSTQTTHAGTFRFLVLLPGTYSVTTSQQGFRDMESVLQVEVGRDTLQDLKLQVGAGA